MKLLPAFSLAMSFLISTTAWGFNMGPLFKDSAASEFDDEDIEMFIQAFRKAASETPVGETVNWENPATTASGSIQVKKEFELSGHPCRTLTVKNQAKGRMGKFTGSVCRNAEGKWKAVSKQQAAAAKP